jgi:hypothetical protein
MNVPTLVIAGDEDDPTLEPSLFLKRSIMSSALLVMPKCGHTMNPEDPDAFNRAVLDFVTQVDCGPLDTADSGKPFRRHHRCEGKVRFQRGRQLPRFLRRRGSLHRARLPLPPRHSGFPSLQ